jgi:hypothetical protein
MKEKIEGLITRLEAEEGITVLFAVESGSREWGFASADSDYDVRCVHVYPASRYLGIIPYRDQIDKTEAPIDLVSWDIHKFAHLLLASNPSVSEWLQSTTSYTASATRTVFKGLFEEQASLLTLKKHYIGMARQNYEHYVRGKSAVSAKKWLYILRGLACSEYIIDAKKIPPMAYTGVINHLPLKLQEYFYECLEAKASTEAGLARVDEGINEWVEKYFTAKYEKSVNTFNINEVDEIVRNVVISYGV